VSVVEAGESLGTGSTELDCNRIARNEHIKLGLALHACRTRDDGRCIKSNAKLRWLYASVPLLPFMDWNRLFGRLFVAFVLFLITFIGYSSQIFIIWPWYGRELSVELLGALVPFK
jgi:hypothetical protein